MMQKKLKLLLALVLAVCLLAVLPACVGGKGNQPEQPISEITAAADDPTVLDLPPGDPEDWNPDIRFTTLDEKGSEWTDACFRDAQLTMINFWAYWCGPCVSEMPDLQKLSEDYAEWGLQILGISDKEYEEENIYVLEQLGVTYPCLRYTADFDLYLNTGYIPDTVFVDSSGKVVSEVYIGSKSYADWAAIVESLLP